jgi:HlyD family secretion protein
MDPTSGREPGPTTGSAGGSNARLAWTGYRRRRPALLAAVIVAALLGAYALLHRTGAETYQTVSVSRGNIQRSITASGTVNPVSTIQVGTYVSGAIQTISCDFNTRVRAGQRCAKIDPRPYQTIVDQDSAALATARAQQAKDEANLAYTKLAHERAVELLQHQMVAQDAVDSALNANEQARAQVELDKASVAQHVAALNAARVNLDYTNITSPVDGTVVSRNVTQGQTVAASFQTPTLFLIATDLTQMQVDTNVSEADIGSVALGDQALFSVEAYPDRAFVGTVAQRRQAPQSVQNVITYDAVVAVKNTDLRLMPGMTAAVRIVTAERSDVLRVPNPALRYTPGGVERSSRQSPSEGGRESPAAERRGSHRTGSVWRLRDGKPLRVPLELGLEDDSWTEVLGGELKVGDAVIVGESAAAAGSGAPRMPRL